MTPKEKAAELVMKYKDAHFNCKGCTMPFCDIPCTMLSIHEAKLCALIAVDVTISEYSVLQIQNTFCYNRWLFWQEVIKEIENL